MKLAVITTGLHTGGAEVALLRLLPAMREHGLNAMVISLRSEGAIGPRLRESGVPVVALGLPSLTSTAAAWAALLRHIRAFSPALLHGWMYHGNLAALAAGGWLRLPVMWGIRQSLGLGTQDKWLTRRIIDIGAGLSKRADLVVYNSGMSRAQHESRGYAAARAAVVPNGFDTDAWRPDEALRLQVRQELGIDRETPLVAQVARYHPGKDYPTLLRAAARVVALYPATRFLLVGKGVDASNSALTALVRDLKLQTHVRLLGCRQDIARLLCAVDVATLSSAGMEGFPNALGEAMSCGIPCVGTSIGDVPDLIGDTGVVVHPADSRAFAAALTRLLSLPPSQRRALGARARRRIMDNFSIDRVATRYAELVFQVAGRDR